MNTLASPRLQQLAQRRPLPAADGEERCDVCGEALPPSHRHIADLESQRLLCACHACRILFDRTAAGGDRFRLVPERPRALPGFVLDDPTWAALRIPVEMAFFFHSTPAGRVVALYPGPMGATESQLTLDAWAGVVAANPALEGMAPDVEALLVHRGRAPFIVPIDRAYALVGTIRGSWKGLGGGNEVWREIAEFFDQLSEETA
ncbi:MAG TPA: DUF5947 family protein [Solirubrobacter sp.]|jgi:hypothetical protein|nr:DUF5947 family protein [Solirubrobacter sp.]